MIKFVQLELEDTITGAYHLLKNRNDINLILEILSSY